jgi:sarcosine oxidase subunit beta
MANPLATTRALLGACARLGATVWTHCGVDRIEVRGDHDFVLHTPRGLVRTPIVLSATGAWNPDIARLLGISLPIGTEVQQVLTTTAGAPVFPHIISHIRGNLTAKQSRGTGKILIGGAWPGDGDRATGCKRVRRDSVIGNLRWAVRHIPAIARTRLLRAWVGFEGRTPDKLLISGPVDGLPGFYLLGCASGGFTTAPIGGVIAARYVAALPPDPDWAPYLVSRLLPTRASTTVAAQTGEAGE